MSNANQTEDDILNCITEDVKRMEAQNKILIYQQKIKLVLYYGHSAWQLTYLRVFHSRRWHVQNHKNLERILTGLRALAAVLTEKLDIPAVDFGLGDDLELEAGLEMQVLDPDDAAPVELPTAAKDFAADSESLVQSEINGRIAVFQEDPLAPELDAILRNLSEADFGELSDASAALILPLVARWMQGDDSDQRFAVVFICELVRRFQPIILERAPGIVIRSLRSGINRIVGRGTDYKQFGVSRRDLLETQRVLQADAGE